MTRERPHPTDSIAIGKNPERTRSHNRRVILEAVRLHGPLGRAELARLTRLTAQAVSNIVAELVQDQLLIEQGRRRSGRGQPPVQVAVNPDGGMTAGVEIAADHMVTVLVDLAGTLRASRTVAVRGTTPEHIVPMVAAEVDAVRRAADRSDGRLLGIGVVMPGPFEVEGLTSIGPTTLPGWAGTDAAAVLSAATGESVIVENDAMAAAVAERLHGVGRALRNFCLVYFGAGLGLGIVADGHPYRGAFGNAGEIGHVVIDPVGRPCACGNRGCLERYASLHALQERLAEAGVVIRQPGDLASLHRTRHPIVTAWIAEAAGRLAPVVAMIENLFDPESIIFGGALPEALIDDVVAAMEPLPLSVASRRARAMPRVLRGTTGHLTAALGAAALPILETVTPKLDMAPASDRPAPEEGVIHAHGS